MTRSRRSMVDVCLHWAASAPGRTAYTCLGDGEQPREQLTFAQLDRRARAIAATLAERTSPGDRALLLYPTGVEYVTAFMGCLYAGLAAVPCYPIQARERRFAGRLSAIVKDAAPSVALTTAALRDALGKVAAGDPAWDGVAPVATDEVDQARAGEWRAPRVEGDTLAFLQYTSGTTRAPRGVMVTHANLMHQEALLQRTFGQHAGSVIVSWLPLYHDMGLIGSVLQTLYAGAHGVLMSPAAFLQKPARWLHAIQRFAATTSGGPNFAYDLLLRKVRPEEIAALDLSTWEVAFNGAELVRAETMNAFARAFAPCGFRPRAFRPCYGLAESTLMVTASAGDDWSEAAVPDADAPQRAGRRVVSCGALDGEQRVRVVDPETRRPCADGRVGEVWVSGASVTAGYWGREAESEELFRARLADDDDAPHLRTGDLGFVRDGRLFLAGRLKELVIVRGRNHFPDDLEATVAACHAALRADGCVACALEVDGEDRLLVVQEVDANALDVPAHEVAVRVRDALAREHGLSPHAVLLVAPRSLPRTPSGKKQRRACALAFLEGRLRLVAADVARSTAEGAPAEATDPAPPADATEAALVEEVARVLGVAPRALPRDAPLARCGLDSLKAEELQAALEARLGCVVTAGTILEGASLRALADAVRAAQVPRGEAAPAGDDALGEPRLSEAEKAMWFLHKLAGERGVHTIARAARVRQAVDWDALCGALRDVVARHEALRTTFPALQGQPRPQVHERLEPQLDRIDARGWDDDALRRALEGFAARPFNLERGPLLRLGLYSRADDDHVLALVVHHIVADLWSVCVLLDELGRAYAGRAAGAPQVVAPGPSYRRHLDAVARRLAGDEGRRWQAYWHAALAGLRPLELPTDRARPSGQRFAAATERLRLDAALVSGLRAAAQSRGATLYVLLLAAFQALLAQRSGRDDVVVGSPFHGRHGRQAESLVGCLTNLLALRADLGGDPTFSEHLERTRRSVAGALDHQEYPFQRLVETLRPARAAGRTPLVSVVFVFQSVPRAGAWSLFALGEPGARLDLGPLSLECLDGLPEATPFELQVTAAACDDELALAFTYRTDLFDRHTVLDLAGRYQALLARLALDPDQRLGRLLAEDRAPRALPALAG